MRQEAVPRAIIRPAAAHDLARIEEIYDAIHTAEEAGNVSIGWVRGVYPTRATAQAALDAGELFVLESDGTVYAAGHGYGTQFVRFYARRARALGCTVLRIDTNAKNTRARRLYARLGFREAAIVPCTFNSIAGVELVCLEKRLDAE